MLAAAATIRRWWPWTEPEPLAAGQRLTKAQEAARLLEESRAHLAPAVAWALILLAIVAGLFLLGWRWRGNPRGIVTGSRNVTSLSLLQLIGWTALVCSAIVTVALWQAHGLSGKPEIVDGELVRPEDPLGDVAWQATAATGTSAIATTLLIGKRKRRPDDQVFVDKAKADVFAAPGDRAAALFKSLAPEEQLPDGRTAVPLPPDKGRPANAARTTLVSQRIRQVQDRLVPEPVTEAQKAAAALEPTEEDLEQAVRLTAVLVAHVRRDELVALYKVLLEGRETEQWRSWKKSLQKLLSGKPASAAPGWLKDFAAKDRDVADWLGKVDEVKFRNALKRVLQAGTFHEAFTQADGLVFRNLCACQARMLDMLEGDEVTNQGSKEGTKIQFLLFTLAGLVAYGAVLWQAFRAGGFGDLYLPKVPEHLTEIMGASGAGYLIGKAPDRSKT